MAIIQYAKRTIDSKIEELINDNTSKDISAADVRSIVKDYVTNSTYAPVMIYAGELKRRSASGSNDSIIKDYYYNSEYFNQQNENSPMAAGNIVQLSAVGAPGTANGTYTQRYGDVSSGTGDLLLEYTVSSNVITNLKVTYAGFGIQPGSTYNLVLSGVTIVVTYNGVISKNSSAGSAHRFTMSTNLDIPANGNAIRNHYKGNTLLTVSGATADMTDSNEFKINSDGNYLVQIYRVTL
jgi:hypothetical protein